ncbi:SHOCT domain-containing protein [Geodermatophilus sp. SYSU D00965]
MRRFAVGLLVVVSAVSLVLASTSLWTRRNVVNTHVFVTNVETMVDLPAVEARITERVTSTVMDNPTVKQAVADAVAVLPPRLQTFQSTVEEGISSLVSAGVRRLLTDDPFRPLTRAALTSAHDQLIAGEPVRFTLGQAKARVPASLQDGLAGQVLALLPDDVGVTIVTPADAPQLYTAIDLLKSVWWWLGLLALGTLAGALGVSRRRRGTLRAWAVTTTVLTLLVLLALRVGRGVLVTQVREDNRDAVGAIYDVLAAGLRSWTLWLLAAALLVLVLTLVWGRLGLVAGVRRGVASARATLRRRREESRAAAALAAEGAEPAADGVPAEPWTRRVAAGTRAFAEGLDLPQRTARLGGFVRTHLVPARWTGIALGALLLLFWPAPTLSVLIWIAALVALYLGALAWLADRAPAPAPGAGEETVTAVARSAGPDGVPLAGAPAVVPAPRPGPAPTDGAADRAPGGTLVATAVEPAPSAPASAAPPAPAPPEPERFVPAALTPETITTLNDRLDLLVRLGTARDAGVLTEEEFRREKGRLLGV